jgi:hypothetical protein
MNNAEVKSALAALVASNKGFERLDPDPTPRNPIPGCFYSVRHGMFDLIVEPSSIRVRIGSKFAEPRSYNPITSSDKERREAYDARNAIVRPIVAEVKRLFALLGTITEVHGSAHHEIRCYPK